MSQEIDHEHLRAIARDRKLKHKEARRRDDEERRRRADQALEGARSNAQLTIRRLPQVVEEFVRAGTIEGSVYVVNVGELVRPVRTFFKPRVTYGHLPDYAKRVFDYCQNNGLFPRLEYWDTASNPDSHFSFDSANHRVASDAFIYAGWKALKALRRSTPNG